MLSHLYRALWFIFIYAFQHEKHEAKKDEEHVGRHKLEEKFAEAVAISAGGYALHEHHEKKEAKEEIEEAGGEEHKKKHHFFQVERQYDGL